MFHSTDPKLPFLACWRKEVELALLEEPVTQTIAVVAVLAAQLSAELITHLPIYSA